MDKEQWEERYNKLLNDNWEEPEWQHMSYDNLVDYTKKLIGITKEFIASEKAKSWNEALEAASREMEKEIIKGIVSNTEIKSFKSLLLFLKRKV